MMRRNGALRCSSSMNKKCQNPETMTSISSSVPLAMHRIALFIDAMGRGTLLATAPFIVGALLRGDHGEIDIRPEEESAGINFTTVEIKQLSDIIPPLSLWPSVVLHTAALVSLYITARSCGMCVGHHSNTVQSYFSDMRGNSFSTTVGLVLAFQLFCLDPYAFRISLLSLYLTRATIGFLIGLLHSAVALRYNMAHLPLPVDGQTNNSTDSTMSMTMTPLLLSHDHDCSENEDSTANGTPAAISNFPTEPNQICSPYLYVDSGIAKLWLTGFASSVLIASLIYYPLRRSCLLSTIMGANQQMSLQGPILTVALCAVIVLATKSILHFCCIRISSQNPSLHLNNNNNRLHSYTNNSLLPHQEHTQSIPFKDEKIILGINPSFAKSTSIHSNPILHQYRVRLDSGTNTTNRLRFDSYASSHGNGHTHRIRLNSYNSATCRSRLDSSASNDLFFDCESHIGSLSFDLADIADHDEDNHDLHTDIELGVINCPDHASYTTEYVNGKCVFKENSKPSPVLVGCKTSIPPRAYDLYYRQNSHHKWLETQRWRMENRIWRILSTPQPFFRQIKDSYPHYIHGFTKQGYPIVYEKPGQMRLKQLFRGTDECNCQISDMVSHYSHFLEFISNIICNKPNIRQLLDEREPMDVPLPWGMVVVLDVTGASLSILSGDVLRYMKESGDMRDSHYPMSLHKCFVVNSPFWLAGAYGTVKKGIIPENVPLEILSSRNQLDSLRKFIDDDQIPKEYGGSSPYALGEHPFEKELYDLVDNTKDNDFDEKDEDDIDLFNTTNAFDGIPNSNNIEMTNFKEDSKAIVTFSMGDDLFKPDHKPKTSTHECLTPPKTLHEMSPSTTYHHNNVGLSQRRNHDTPSGILSQESSPLRRSRLISHDSQQISYSFEKVFMLTSIMHFVCYCVQGTLETTIPLWLMIPTSRGGLGYEPPRVGVTVFSVILVIMRLLRTKVCQMISNIPVNAPIRGFRIGVGSQAFLLPLLPLIPFLSGSDNMLVMASTILFITAMLITSMLGRSSSSILHLNSTKAYFERLNIRCEKQTTVGSIINKILLFFITGGFTYGLGIGGEIVGSLFVAPFISWSISESRVFPFDSSFSFHVGCGVCILLYISSFSLQVKLGGEILPRSYESDEKSKASSRKSSVRCALATEVLKVSVGDMASLFEESNWSSSSALGREHNYSGRQQNSMSPGAYKHL